VSVVCGGISHSSRGALQRRGSSAGKRVGVKRNTEQSEPVRKGNNGSDEGDPKPPKQSAATKHRRHVQGQQKEGLRAPHHGKVEEKKDSVCISYSYTKNIKR
jgi:hypothetical protein